MTAVKKDATPITWTDSLAASLDVHKILISQATLLCYPIEEARLSLKVDVSKRAIGDWLQHVSDGKQRLAFVSAQFEPDVYKYNAFHHEQLTVYSTVQHFQLIPE
ncbi:hypothetical protein TNCV_2760561 [Trichonephila clavipes]|nr:hypothetical protein TNCV_2760561 [Trichonephila clavipes]